MTYQINYIPMRSISVRPPQVRYTRLHATISLYNLPHIQNIVGTVESVSGGVGDQDSSDEDLHKVSCMRDLLI